VPSQDHNALQTFLTGRDVPCPKCGYNLKGLDIGTCPECGFGFDAESLRYELRVKHATRDWFIDRAPEIVLGINFVLLLTGIWFGRAADAWPARLLHWPGSASQIGALVWAAWGTGAAALMIDRRTGFDPTPRVRRIRMRLLGSGVLFTLGHAIALVADIA
jgi:hypothetical protein